MELNLKKIHNLLRNNYSLYHKWHNFKYSTHIHFLVLIGFVLAVSIFQLNYLFPNQNQIANALTSQSSLTTQADWEAGTLVGIDAIINSGDIKINNDTTLIPQSSYVVSASANSEQKDNVKDNNLTTAWGGTLLSSDPYWIKINLGVGKIISKIKINNWLFNYDPPEEVGQYIGIDYSIDDITYSVYDICSVSYGIGTFTNGWEECNEGGNINMGRYVRFIFSCTAPDCDPPTPPLNFDAREIELYEKPLTATHTSAPSQIGATGDATRYVSEYQSFTPTESEPANSDITYRFRLTTSDGATTGSWTDYVDYTGTAIDLTAYSTLAITQTEIDAGKTYLQVETKFVRTDVSASPTVSDYTASYHTNKPPNAPVPQ